MTFLEQAKRLAKLGFYVFPIKENGKTPAIFSFTPQSTRDEKSIEKFWIDPIMGFTQPHNIGIATGRFEKDCALLVVDVDNKDGKKGTEEMNRLKLNGCPFPETYVQKTPTGGLHYVYRVKEAVKQGVDVLAPGLDTRSRGGYVVASGSLINGVPYTDNNKKIADAPEWLIKKCNEFSEKVNEKEKKKSSVKVNQDSATKRAILYLETQAPLAIQGQGGDQTTFKVASRLKDFGVEDKIAFELMCDYWNERCEPPWDPSELSFKVSNAYIYGQNAVGKDAPENDFADLPDTEEKEITQKTVDNPQKVVNIDEKPPISDAKSEEKQPKKDLEDPLAEISKKYAFAILGGRSTIIYHEKKELFFMNVQAFHDYLKGETIQLGDGKVKQLSELWMSSKKRPSYLNVGLFPNQKTPDGYFNLWRGFSVEPLAVGETPTAKMQKGLDLFKEHTLKNVCGGDEKLCSWLLGYFAHIIQKPYEKPLVALVFKGLKGVGKNILIDQVGSLISEHYLLTSERRYLIGNFNKHMANLLMFTLDEANWAGDKQTEGKLKDLITGSTHLIEHKGREMFSTKNLTRIIILGNEDWLVPATYDERRFGVFNVGADRKQDRKFFGEMNRCLKDHGGNRLLLRFLMDYDLTNIDVDQAPSTIGLLEQKLETLSPIHTWWLTCLRAGQINNMDFDKGWVTEIDRDDLYESFMQYARRRNIRAWVPDDLSFVKRFLKCIPSVQTSRPRVGKSRVKKYHLPSLMECRKEFERFIGHELEWDEIEAPPEKPIDPKDIFS